MELTLHFAADVEKRLRERAHEHGVDVTEYVEELVAKDLQAGAGQGGGRTFAEILAPAHEYARSHHQGEEEIGRFVDTEVTAFRAERRARRGEA